MLQQTITPDVKIRFPTVLWPTHQLADQ